MLLSELNSATRQGKVELAASLAAEINNLIAEKRSASFRNLNAMSPKALWQAVRRENKH